MNTKEASKIIDTMVHQLQDALSRRQAVKEYAEQLRNYLDFVIDNSK